LKTKAIIKSTANINFCLNFFLSDLIKANFLKSSFALRREASLNQLITSRRLFHFCKKSKRANVPPDKLSKYTQSFKTTIERAAKNA